MTNLENLYGSIVALVTPFRKDGSLDLKALKKLIEWHVESGTQAIVVLGTTGEAATLTDDEDALIATTALKIADGRIPIISGASCNCTREAKRLVSKAKDYGVDAVLVLTPYYNKPPQEGIYKHFQELNEVGIPLIVYNCPGRTASNVEPDTMMKIAKLENVIGCKEASGDVDQIKKVLEIRPEGFKVFSGDDSITLELLPFGIDGCISVFANEFPAEFQEMFVSYSEGNLKKAESIHKKFLPLMDLNFVETNPIPVKTALELMGKIPPVTFRLPLVPLKQENRIKLKTLLSDYTN